MPAHQHHLPTILGINNKPESHQRDQNRSAATIPLFINSYLKPVLHKHFAGYEDGDPNTASENKSTVEEERHMPCGRDESSTRPEGEAKCTESHDNTDHTQPGALGTAQWGLVRRWE